MLECVREIASNLAYIRKELPELEMPEEQRRSFPETCGALSQDADGLRSATERLRPDSRPGPGAIEAMQAEIRGQVRRLDEWVTAARALAAAEPGCVALKVLLEESGANMLRAYMGLWEHVERLRAAPPQG